MPRAKKIEWKTQEYDIGDGATVTVRYDTARRPKMFHNDRTAIVGDHVCNPAPMVLHNPAACPETPYPETPRGGNFGFEDGDPAYAAFKAQQQGGGGRIPAPPGISPTVLTSEELFGMRPGSGELSNLLAGEAPIENPEAS